MRNKFKISLQFSMLSIFLSLFVFTTLTIIIVTTMRLYSSMMVISNQQMEQVTSLVNNQLHSHIHPAEMTSQLTLKLINKQILDPENTDKMLNYTLEVLETLNNVAMVYWGDKNGNFTISRLESDGTLSSEVIVRRDNKSVSTFISRDKNKKPIKENMTEGATFDPRERPWYIAAKQAKNPIWSKPYVFFTGETKRLGTTFASPIFDNNNQLLGVFGIDVKLDVISEFLSKLKVGRTGVAFIINDEGQLVAHPKLNKLAGSASGYRILPVKALKDPPLRIAVTLHNKTKKNKFSFNHRNKIYLAEFKDIPSFKKNKWSIVVVIPEDDFIGGLKLTNLITLTLSGIILFFGIMLIALFSEKISASVNNLVRETEKIKEFDLTSSVKIDSSIKEVSQLSSGIASMRKGLKSFQKYVPADLVRTLIHRHEDATLGGTKKKITIIFTDIDGFTTISETMPPHKLLIHISAYFQHLTRIIIRQQGTIDKYIGDAIMAFWGSPVKDSAQVFHACKTALAIQDRLKLLNKRWSEENKPMLPTRIGIHTGNAIVGNLGSSERLSYTAIGDTINIASRIENINKIYGTRIIVSQAIKDEADGQFIFKELDCITVKGKTQSMMIYELLAEKGHKHEKEFNIISDMYSKAFEKYRKQEWDIAKKLYSKILEEHPNELAAKLFVDRCEQLKNNPPGPEWTGTWVYLEK